jgi:phosphotransferase system IIB component
MLQVNLKHLETRERELDGARRQIRDLNFQLEQRDLVQKRTQLVNILTEKETRLKILVKDQEKVESEIREREDAMRKILSEQEKVEKELVEGKQAQRHYQELAKKDKTPRGKLNKSEEGLGSQIFYEEPSSPEND